MPNDVVPKTGTGGAIKIQRIECKINLCLTKAAVNVEKMSKEALPTFVSLHKLIKRVWGNLACDRMLSRGASFMH